MCSRTLVPQEDRPSASGSGPLGGSTSKIQTDLDSINDAVGISGVDVAAEEELAKQQSLMYGRAGGRTNSLHWAAPQERVKIMDFLDKSALTVMVQHIAASYQLKTLEPAILDVLTQAAEHRIHALIVDSIAAKDHRIASTHLRPPPLYPAVQPKGKQKEVAPEAMYDQLLYDQPERILSMLARVEGEEERKTRLDRESLEAGEEDATLFNKDPSQPPPPSIVPEPSRTHPPDQSGSDGFNYPQNKKEKKRKREGPGQLARNMSEDARARQSNQTAMRSVGGKTKYSWLSGGVVNPSGNFTPVGTSSTFMASLPAPKFAPQSKLSTKYDSPNPAGSNSPTATTTTASTAVGRTVDSRLLPRTDLRSQQQRLGGILPGSHLSHLEPTAVSLKDCLFALERERGSGAGRGSGSRTLFKSYVIGRAKD